MEKEQQPLKFKPMTKGLGFHPFSDGLPYAPVSKSPQISSKRQTETAPAITQPSLPKQPSHSKQAAPEQPAAKQPFKAPPRPIAPQRLASSTSMSTGTGAVSAGAPQFVFPGPAPAKPSAPVQARKPAPIVPEPLTQARIGEETPGVLYLFKRAAAFVLDTAINLALSGTAFGTVLWKLGIPVDRLVTPEILGGSILFFVAFNWALITAQEIAFKTSLGKRAFGLTLEGATTSALFLRAFFFVFSAGFMGLGLLWALYDKRRRCWHDLFADAAPREIASL